MPNILIADDSSANGNMISLVLTMEGHDVRVTNSKAALVTALADHNYPDIILLDVQFGRDDGREICSTIKKENQAVKIILLSASKENLLGYKECQADDFLEKPFEIEILIHKVNKLLNC